MQATGAAGQDFGRPRCSQALVRFKRRQIVRALAQLFFFAKANLRGYIGPGHTQGAGLATTTLTFEHGVTHQGFDGFHRVLQLHRAVTGVVVEIACARHAVGSSVRRQCSAQGNALFQQILMDVDDAAAREYFVELVALQLVVASAATDHHGFDVQVVQGIGYTVKQYAVIGNDFFRLVCLTTAALRVAAAQITRRQHGLHTRMPEHGLRSQAHLAE